MNRTVVFILTAGLMAIAIFVFAYPHIMVAPGKLIPAHQQLNNDCFACHTPFIGASAKRCMTCHKPEDIGRLTTTGEALTKKNTSIPFHQQLISQDCLSCHTDHAGVQRLKPAGNFDHALLKTGVRDECGSCHKSPTDSLHRQISGNCRQCHSQNQWSPATFDHTKYFVLDNDHSTQCVTCHVGNNYQRYTCYGCHEHTPENIRSEHREEGISDINNCIECHRSANKHENERGRGDGNREHDN